MKIQLPALFGFTKKAATLVVASGLLATTVCADDTEVFFPPVDSGLTQSVRPNILFIMDTSGSMANTDGTNTSRLDRVKQALNSILDEMAQNTNVGLMRLSDDEGGPVLFPVSHIEANADEIEAACTIAGADNVSVVGAATGNGETAQELGSTGITVVDPPVLAAGLIPGVVGGVKEVSFRGRSSTSRDTSFDDAQQQADGSRFTNAESYLRLGNRVVGLRFPGVTVPAGATILSAHLDIGVSRNRRDSSPTNIQIRGELVANSPDFSVDPTVVGRDTTNAVSTTWSVPRPASGDAIYTSPDFAPVVQEIIDQAGWVNGQALSLILSGSGRRYMYNNTAGSDRPRLVIQYEVPTSFSTSSRVGMRFPEMNIPQGVTITSAYVDFMPAAVDSSLASFRFYGEDVSDSAALTSGIAELSSRTHTSNSVAWSGLDLLGWDTVAQLVDGIVDPAAIKTSPDLSPIIQEIVNRGDWCGGNAISLFLEPTILNLGLRSFFSGATSAELAPVLRVGYSRSDPQADLGCTRQIGVSQISNSNDDAEERLSSGEVLLGSADLELGYDGSSQQLVAMRFTNVQIAQGGDVQNARIEFTARGTSFGSSSLTFNMENVGDAGALNSINSHLSDRAASVVAGSVSWSPEPFDIDGGIFESPDLSDLLQAVVNRSDWVPGNDIVVFVRGSGTRRAWSVDGSLARAPRLLYSSIGAIPGKTVRQRLKELVNDFEDTGYTPVVEVLTEAAHYYRGEEVYFGRTRGSGVALNDYNNGDGSVLYQDDLRNAREMRVSHCASYTGGTQVDPPGCTSGNLNSTDCEQQHIDGNPVYISPMTDACQSNNIVLLTDGLPNNNNNSQLISAITGSSCSGDGCGPALADALAHADQAGWLNGDQMINTYTIGFANFESQTYLEEIAERGNGTFSPASDAEGLANRFREIIATILDNNTTFVAPAVTINSFNRLTHLDQLYFALFRPEAEVSWKGNLKRFRLQADPGQIVDVNSAPAVDPDTGFFFDDATSYWTTDGPDGGTVTKGGAASRVASATSRLVLTSVSGSDLSSPTNRVVDSNQLITKAMLGIEEGTTVEEIAASDALRKRVLDWARGVDVNDEDGDGNRTEMRHAIGDPLHSEPVLVTYSAVNGVQDIAVFMGTNEGFVHAFNGTTGEEYFAFIPEELLGNLRYLESNTGSWAGRPYGMDGPLVATATGVGASKRVILVAGMRRGGRSYYALDVTNRTAPTIKWSITGGATPGFSELGQTWSAPIPATVRYGGENVDVLIFGGGYDEGQDAPLSAARSDSVGRAVFMVRASNGELLWSAGHAAGGVDLVVSDMQASVPATPGVIDLDNDGLVDRIYITDTNAKLFRFDVNQDNSGRSSFATGGMIAHAGGTTAETNRRFYNAPDIAITLPFDQDPILTISVGSGYRAHPLEMGVQDRFYVFFDPDVAVGDVEMFTLGPVDDTATELYDATSNLIGSSDPDVAEAAREEMWSKRGAYINLREGEKALTVSRTFDNKVVFSTFQPGSSGAADVCSAGVGTARLYVLNVLGLSPADDLNESGGELTTGDRDKELRVAGIPPKPVILFPDPGEQPINPIIFVGPESYQPGLEINAEKTSWETLQPDVPLP